MKITGKAIRLLRAKHSVSLKQLAEQAGISYVTISLLETNKQSLTIEQEQKLVNALYHFGITDADISLVLTWIMLRKV